MDSPCPALLDRDDPGRTVQLSDSAPVAVAPLELERTALTSSDWLPGYEPAGVLGEGSFGTVFKARQLSLDRDVAVKILRAGPRADAPPTRLRLEAVTLAKFHHPNIVQIHDTGCCNGLTFLVMELLEGEDLDARLGREGALDERTAWLIARQAVVALAHAKSHGVVHRDVKPANLFLVPAPTGAGLPPGVPLVKVTDFGLALASGEAARPGSGTPAYMAPEQHRGDPGLDHRADIFALGATVFRALVGTMPFPGQSVAEVLAQKLTNTLRPAPGLSQHSSELLAAMLAADPRNRVSGYEELTARIDQLLAIHDSAAPPNVPLPARRRVPRRAWRIALALGVVAAVIGSWTGRATTPPPASVPLRFVSSGHAEALLQSGSMAGWLPPTAGGVWQIEPDIEGVKVYAGTGMTRCAFARFENYRVLIGLDLHRATVATVQFGLPERDPETGRRFALRVTRAGGAQFGTQDGTGSSFNPIGEPVPFPSDEWLEGRRPYLEVRFERAGSEWAAWFNGVLAGRALDDGVPKASEVRLAVEGGQARVDSAMLEALERATD